MRAGLTNLRPDMPGNRLQHRRAQRHLARRCQDRLATLELPFRFSLREMRDVLQQHRRRHLWVFAQPVLPDKVSGLWVGTSSRDYVFYRAGVRPAVRDNIIAHEFSHMICDHRSARVVDEAWARRHLPWLSELGNVERLFLRADYTVMEEQEAEYMASLILAHTTGHHHHRRRGTWTNAEQSAIHRTEAMFFGE